MIKDDIFEKEVFSNIAEEYKFLLFLLETGNQMHIYGSSPQIRTVPNNNLYNGTEEYWANNPERTRIIGLTFASFDMIGVALNISRIQEVLNKTSTEIIEAMYDEISQICDIETAEPYGKREIIRQLRNCVAHANYSIISNGEYRDANGYRFELNNGKIKTTISMVQLSQIYDVYCRYVSSTVGGEKDYFSVFLASANDIFNHASLENFLESSYCCEISGEQDDSLQGDNISEINEMFSKTQRLIDTNSISGRLENMRKYKGFNKFSCNIRKFSEEEKEIFRSFIRNIGFHNWRQIQKIPAIKQRIYCRLFSEAVFPERNIDYKSYQALLGVTFGDEKKESKANEAFLELTLLSPIYYSRLLLLYMFYTFNFIRESNEKSGRKYFDYKDLDLSGLKISIGNKEELIKYVDPVKKIQQEINALEAAINKRKKQLTKLDESRKKNENPNNRNPNKKKKLEENRQDTEEVQNKLDELLKQKKEKEKKLERAKKDKPYYDSRNLFRHIRNSISHGRYKIEYKEAFRRKDLTKIKIHFQDFDEETNKICFQASISASNLLRIIEQIQRRILERNEKTLNSNDIGKLSFDAPDDKCDEAQKILSTLSIKCRDGEEKSE